MPGAENWTAEIVYWPNPRPKVLKTTDIHVEVIQGPLRAIECHLREQQKRIRKATLEPPGMQSTPQEYVDRIVTDRPAPGLIATGE
jgi:hypothetical protein